MIFTGYQADGTPGRTVLDTGRLVFDDLDVKPKMDVRYLDFSDHADRGQLLRFFNDVKPKKIIVMHGEHTDNFAKELKAKGFDAAAMKNGETVTV
jgi:putative mRNA 3-end processing factor